MASRRIERKVAVLLFGACAFAGALGVVSLEAGIRILHPEATRGHLVARLKRERDSWARPDSMFHHVGDGIFHMTFPVPGETVQHRIMMVGDSFVMGHIVGEEARFGTLLQRRLGSKAKVDVLATSSYSPVIYRNIVRQALRLAHYDAVAVFVDQTDPADELVYQKDLKGAGIDEPFDAQLMVRRSQAIREAYDRLIASVSRWNSPRRSAALNFLRPLSIFDAVSAEGELSKHLQLTEFTLSDLITRFNTEPNSLESKVALSLLLRHLDQIVAMCQAAHVPLVLTANPWEVQTSAHPRVTYNLPPPYPAKNRLEQLLVDRYGRLPGVHVLRMTENFRRYPDPSNLFLTLPENEIHWNERGHAFVENLVEDYLLHELHVPKF